MNSGNQSSTSCLINSVERKVSTNDKEDFIKERLRRLEIAYSVMAKYPAILEEYVSAVKGEIAQ